MVTHGASGQSPSWPLNLVASSKSFNSPSSLSDWLTEVSQSISPTGCLGQALQFPSLLAASLPVFRVLESSKSGAFHCSLG